MTTDKIKTRYSHRLFQVVLCSCLITRGYFSVYGGNEPRRTVCAYSNNGPGNTCFSLELKCDIRKHIEILNAVCGTRNYFDPFCIRSRFVKCSSQTGCCRNQYGDIRWPMTEEHRRRLNNRCDGKRDCIFKAPVDKQINYIIHYCYVLYRCAEDLTITVTKNNTPYATPSTTPDTQTYTTLSKVLKHKTNSTSERQPVFPTIHGRNGSSLSNDSDAEKSETDTTSLLAGIISAVVIVFGAGVGALLCYWKRYKKTKHHSPVNNATSVKFTDEQETCRTSNQYDNMHSDYIRRCRTDVPAGDSMYYNVAVRQLAECDVTQHNTCYSRVHNKNSVVASESEVIQYSIDKPQVSYPINHRGSVKEKIEAASSENEYNKIFYMKRNSSQSEVNVDYGDTGMHPGDVKCDGDYSHLGMTIPTSESQSVDDNEGDGSCANPSVSEDNTYFVLEPEDPYNHINPEDVESIAAPDNEYDKINFSNNKISSDPNYDVMNTVHRANNETDDYSILSNNSAVQVFGNIVDYAHLVYKERGEEAEQDGHYFHLNCTRKVNLKECLESTEYSHLK